MTRVFWHKITSHFSNYIFYSNNKYSFYLKIHSRESRSLKLVFRVAYPELLVVFEHKEKASILLIKFASLFFKFCSSLFHLII